ncbi:hypothetical protein CAL7102_04558 [Dulcicalothrix desertica PCC 7102]|nr:hypothetical protein CAL7102_04558 [Dulcicalothrix desertica PCC 7102]
MIDESEKAIRGQSIVTEVPENDHPLVFKA